MLFKDLVFIALTIFRSENMGNQKTARNISKIRVVVLRISEETCKQLNANFVIRTSGVSICEFHKNGEYC